MDEMKEYAKRRTALFKKMEPNSIAILRGAKTRYRSEDSEYPFHQDNYFYYLTGFKEHDAFLVLIKEEQGKEETILFCLDKNKEEEIWTGERVGPQAAVSQYGLSKAFDIKELDNELPKFMNHKKICYYKIEDKTVYHKILHWTKHTKITNYPFIFEDLSKILNEMRLYKSPFEIKVMQKAAVISAEAHTRLMTLCKPGLKEYDLEAEFVYDCLKHGARAPTAYPSIVGAGKQACVLHYTNNDETLQNGELVLIDAGCEYEGYASDITRTFPINGQFTPDQKALYEVVLEAQEAAIAIIKPGLAWNEIQNTILNIMVPGLVRLGILSGDPEKLIADKAYLPFYPHGSGHWLGLDVHDVGSYKVDGAWRSLEPGMVLTVEPGIYIQPDQTQVEEKWKGIGIRIEDDILVTEQGHEILSKKVPKKLQDIEALMKK